MTRVLVLGATGMLGHKVLQRLGSRFEMVGAARAVDAQTEALAALTGATIIGGLDPTSQDGVAALLRKVAPDAVVNCVGVIKQREGSTEREDMIRINALFPHELARATDAMGARLIHLSTDCVFSGARGNYSEADRPDPVDAYGASKFLGEPSGSKVLTLRTSMIGRELRGHHSLLDWFLQQTGPEVRGFVNAIFSGLTSSALADEVGRVIGELPALAGLYHVSVDPISKYDLLRRIGAAYGRSVRVVPDERLRCDRSLDSTAYRALTGFSPPAWDSMIQDLAADRTPYTPLAALQPR